MAQAARLSLRMQKEIKQLMAEPPPGVSLPLLSENSNLPFSSLSTIQAEIEGPEETVYAKGIFTLKIQIPERYPFHPPNVTFITPIYHPNIDNGGRICLDILNLPPKGAWQPSMNVSTVLISIRLLLSEPNPDDALMAETSKEYKYNRQAFDEKARTWTEKYANPASSGKHDNGSTSECPNVPQDIDGVSTCHDIPVKESDRGRKKLRLTLQNMSSSIVASTGVDNDDEKENATTIPQLPMSELQDLYCSEIVQTAGTKLENENVHDMAKKFPVDKSNRLEASPKLETIIVSDSEESDNESARPSRSRLSLMRRSVRS